MIPDTKPASLPQDPALTELNRMVEELGSQKAAADKLEISQAYMGDILAGNRTISETVLKKIGYIRLVVNVKVDQSALVVSAIEDALRLDGKVLDTARKIKAVRS